MWADKETEFVGIFHRVGTLEPCRAGQESNAALTDCITLSYAWSRRMIGRETSVECASVIAYES